MEVYKIQRGDIGHKQVTFCKPEPSEEECDKNGLGHYTLG